MDEIVDNFTIIKPLLALCVFKPDNDKLSRILNEYKTKLHKKLFIERINNKICGILGIEQRDTDEFEITHIAVLPDYRKKGIGRKMIKNIIDITHCRTLIAETDKDAVDFYRKCGFEIIHAGEKYPGRIRYRCMYLINSR